MGQRFDALKAGATGTNAMNYIKANPFTSLGVATAAMTPDENNTPQKAADTDRGPRSKLQYYSGYGTSLPAPNMQGIEQTYNRPYYAAKGGVTRMATGGITSAPRNQQQLFADYLQRVSSSGTAATTPPTNKYEWWKNSNDPAPAAPAPAETAEEYAARMRLNARGGGGGMSAEQRAEQAADNARPQPMLNGLSRDQFFKLSPEEQKAVRAQADMDNPKTAAFFNALKFVASPGKYLYDAFRGPEPASEMQKYIDAADAESRALTRDRAYEAYGNSIEGVTASDAAAAEAQRVQAEAANLAQMQTDTYPSGNFADAPLSSRTDVSGYPLRESELRSFEKGLAPTSAQVKKGDPFAGFFSPDPTLNQIAKYGDPFKQDAKFFPPGTAPTDKQFFRDRYGNLFAPGDSIPAGTTVGGNSYLADRNKIPPALSRQEGDVPNAVAQTNAALTSNPLGTAFSGSPFASNDMSSIYAQMEANDRAEEAKEKAEQAKIAAAEEKAYAERTTAGNDKKVDVEKNLRNIITGLEADKARDTYPDGTPFTPNDRAMLNASLMQTLANYTVNETKNSAKGETSDQLRVYMDRLEQLRQQEDKKMSPFSDRVAPENKGAFQKYYLDSVQQAKENLEPGDRFAPLVQDPKSEAIDKVMKEYRELSDTPENQDKKAELMQKAVDIDNDIKSRFLTPEQYQAEVNRANADITPAAEKAVAQTNAALTPTAESNAYGLGYVGKDPTTGLAIGDPRENTSTFNSSLPTTNQVFGINEVDPKYKYNFTPAVDFTDENASQLFGLDSSDYDKVVSDLGQYNLGTLAPDALRYSGTGVPDTLNMPTVPGAISADPNADKKTETLGIPSAETFAAMIGPSLGQYAAVNNGVVSDAGVLGGVPAPNMGNTGNIRGSFGIGGVWTNKEGIPIRTGDGSLVMTGEGAAAMQRAVAESNAAANRTYGNSINSGPANDGRADPGGEGGTRYGSVAAGYTGGSEAAAGGLSTPYGFQHMAQGGMSSPYDLGSYSDGGRLLRGPGDGVSDSIPATIGKGRPARLADGEFVIPARIVSEIGNGSTEAGARKLYAMMDRIQAGRKKSVGKGKVAVNSRADKYLPA
jgi:hypothetical protein